MANYKIIFSPTGGTKNVADILAQAMGGVWQEIDLTQPGQELIHLCEESGVHQQQIPGGEKQSLKGKVSYSIS